MLSYYNYSSTSPQLQQYVLMINDYPVAILPSTCTESDAQQALENLNEAITEQEQARQTSGSICRIQYAHIHRIPVIEPDDLPT
jgi:hypothetical protein